MTTASPPALAPAHAVLVGLLALVPVVFWRGGMEVFESTRVAALGLLALALLGLCRWRWADLVRGPVALAVLAGLLAATAATVTSVSPWTSLRGAHDSHAGLTLTLALGVVFFAARLLSGATGLAAGVAASLPVVLAYYAVQAAGADPVAWRDLSGYAGWDRPISTLGHPNFLAGYLVVALPLVAWLAGEAWRQKRRLAAAWLLGLCLAAAWVVVASLSRGAWAAGAAAALVFAVGRLRWRGLAAGTAVCAVAVGLLLAVGGRLAEPVLHRLQNAGDLATRDHVWAASWQLFRDRPITGWGPDTFLHVYARHRPAEVWHREFGTTPARAHNELLHTLATQGAVGGAARVGLLLALAWAWWRARRQTRPAGRRLLAAVAAGLTACYVQNLVGFSLVPTGCLFAILAAVLSRLPEWQDEAPQPGAWAGVVGGCAAGWLALAANVLYEGAPDVRAAVLLSVAGGLCAVTAACLRPMTTAPSAAGWPGFGLGRAALAAVLVLAGWTQFVQPWRASWACRIGESWLEADPAEAVAWHRRAVALDGRQCVWWTRLAEAVRRCADREPCPERRRRWRQEERAALEAACAAAPAWAENWANLARGMEVQAREGLARPDAVLPLFDRAVADDPTNTILLAHAARAAAALGQPGRGWEYVERGLRADPSLAILHGERGALCLAEGKALAAERYLLLALRSDWRDGCEGPDRVLGLLCLARLQQGKATAALPLADFLIGRDGDQLAPRVLRAVALERLGRGREASEEYRRVLAARPDHALARAALARLGGR